MKFNRTLAYGLACLQYLSDHSQGGWHETRQICQTQKLPESYCNKVLQSLVHAGFLKSSRGRGFKLKKPLQKINVWEVMEAFTFNGAPPANKKSPSIALYDSMRKHVNHMLIGLTLDEVVESLRNKNGKDPH
ncbi:MAG TPA: Rrf2 family transcriptional regulator [Elusimicrobiota bacterium]|nr:Rrf2 family transcriptional regulator [Elusimicrobiota bacterium]